jgi:hypothetical protein
MRAAGRPPGLDTESPALCCDATEPHTRPDCGLTPVVAFGSTRLCASCAARGAPPWARGQRPRPLQAPTIDVLTWLAAAEHDLRATRHALHAAARRAWLANANTAERPSVTSSGSAGKPLNSASVKTAQRST